MKSFISHQNLLCLLIKFLKTPGLDYSSICSYLIKNIFCQHNFYGALLTSLTPRGISKIEGSFGLDLTTYQSWNNIKIEEKHPINLALKKKCPIILKSLPDIPKDLEIDSKIHFDYYTSTFLSFPINNYISNFGTLNLFSTISLELEEHDLNFYSLVADLLNMRIESGKKYNHNQKISTEDLNERELAIIELIKKGKTNEQIGRLMGYSSSTIRQDTIKIYKKLGLKGRSEIYTLSY